MINVSIGDRVRVIDAPSFARRYVGREGVVADLRSGALAGHYREFVHVQFEGEEAEGPYGFHLDQVVPTKGAVMKDLSGWEINREKASGSRSTQRANSDEDAIMKIRELLADKATTNVTAVRINPDGSLAT